jgi:HK97 family phage major capsid protein
VRDSSGHIGYEERDLTTVSDPAGGYTVPVNVQRTIVEKLLQASSIRQLSTVLTTPNGQPYVHPYVDSLGTAVITGEGTALSESDPALNAGTTVPWKYGRLTQITNELISDTATDLLGFVARNSATVVGRACGTHFATGTGTNQPLGLFTSAGTGVTGGTGVGGATTYDNLVDTVFALPQPYRAEASWLFSDTTLAAVRKLKDNQNRPIFEPGTGPAEPGNLLGYPVYSEFGAPAMGTGVKSAIFGDIGLAYTVHDVNTLRFERSDDFAFDRDVVTFRAVLRSDGRPILLESYTSFRGGTA